VIDKNCLQIREMATALMNFFPYAIAIPARKALKNAVPVSQVRRQQTPLTATAQNPEYGDQKPPTSRFIAHAGFWVSCNDWKQDTPFCITDFKAIRHLGTSSWFHKKSA